MVKPNKIFIWPSQPPNYQQHQLSKRESIYDPNPDQTKTHIAIGHQRLYCTFVHMTTWNESGLILLSRLGLLLLNYGLCTIISTSSYTPSSFHFILFCLSQWERNQVMVHGLHHSREPLVLTNLTRHKFKMITRSWTTRGRRDQDGCLGKHHQLLV